MNEKVNPWIIVSIVLLVLLVGGAICAGWLYLYSDRKLQTALDRTRTAKTKLSQIEFALRNIIDRDIQINRERRGLIIDIGKLRANRRKRDEKDRENRSLVERQQQGLRDCIGIVRECIDGLERSGNQLDGNIPERMD